MKIGMTSLTLREESIENVIKYAKEAGISGIEWGVSEKHASIEDDSFIERIKTESQKNGIEIFSLGSYCNMTDKADCDRTLEVAVKLGAPVIRLWAGRKSIEECDDEYKNTVIENSVYMAEKAGELNIKLGFEYHSYTLTETADSAVELIKEINQSNVGLYWQPDGNLSVEENIKDRNKVLPFLVGNIHIQNYSETKGYMLLEEISDRISKYFEDIKDKDYNVMIEFVKDSLPENVIKDAVTLKKLI